jgi:LemA protein
MEQDVTCAQAQVDRELQRRTDLVKSLLPAVYEYASLERHVFTEVAKVRAQLAGMLQNKAAGLDPETMKQLEAQAGGAPKAGAKAAPVGAAGAGSDQLSAVLGRLIAVSEQYPDMKSSGPFNSFIDKVTEIENRLAAERQKYNDAVNRYTTLRSAFPGALFARIFGFEQYTLFRAEAGAEARPDVQWPQQP